MEINKKALDKSAGKLRVSVAHAHTVIAAYLAALGEGHPETEEAADVAAQYGRGWYVVGQKVHGKKNLPEGVEIVGDDE